MEFEDENLDGDFLCDLLTADNVASFLGEEARLEEHQSQNKVCGKSKSLPPESVLLELPINLSTACVSVIHTGDTDSSDDDDNRNQLDSNLNSYGKSIKSMFPKENPVSHEFLSEKRTSWKAKTKSMQLKSSYSGPQIPKSASDDFFDPVFHIRISERLISSKALQERMAGRLSVSMDGLKRFTEGGDKETDWVLAGTIVFKSPVKSSLKGGQYSIWRLSDLKPGLKTVSVFLFRSAFKELWKTSVGTVVGILNPSIIDNRDGSGDEAALSVDLAQKVMILGKSKDYGLCKSMKKNGERCGVFVNKSTCAVCIYHVQTEYWKCSRRSELQSTVSRTPTLRNKVLGKSEVFYGGKSFTSVPSGRNRNHVTKDKNTIQRLNGIYSKPSCSQVKRAANSKINVEFRLIQADCQDGFITKKNGVDSKKITLENGSAQKAMKSVAMQADDVDSKPSSMTGESRNKKAKQEDCTFLVAESAEDDKEFLQQNIPIITCDKSKNSQIVAVKASNKVIEKNLNVVKEVESSSENLPVVKKQRSNPEVLDVKIKRISTSISNKVDKPKIEASYLGLASRLGLGLNSTIESVKPGRARQEAEAAKAPNQAMSAMSRGEINLKMINHSIAIPEPKKTSCNPQVASNLNMLKEKRNAKFEKKQRVEADLRASKLATLKLKCESSKQAASLTGSSLMSPKVNIGVLENDSKKRLGNNKGNSAPALVSLRSGNGFIDLNDPLELAPSPSRCSAKMNAMKFAKSVGGLKKLDPNATNRGISRAAKRNREPTSSSAEEQSRPEHKVAQSVDISQMKFKQVMETKSRHCGLLEAHDDKEKEDYFNKLEKKEELEEKMMSTFEVKCKAVTCLECRYTSFSAAEICRADGHALKTRDAVKRFFKCAVCGNRTVVLTRIPNTTCSKCRSSHWQRAPMMKERLADPVTFSIRGAEEKYVGSQSGGNINLLVPIS